ncbi:hypothetical protein HOY82DRAFT_605717 [Tuber indicum]|nr:hypothetical protein HOY82DRAFT_605717 [Tuber indicum]
MSTHWNGQTNLGRMIEYTKFPPNKGGGSTKKALANGWSYLDLEAIMSLKTENLSPPTGSPSGSGSISDSSKTNVGAIAGGTVAGVVAVLLGLLGVMMLRRHHLRRRSHLPPRPIKPGGPIEIMGHSQVNRGGSVRYGIGVRGCGEGDGYWS